MTETMHFDGMCPFLTCLETESHDHEICPECDAVRYGNFYCNTCRERINVARGWNLPSSAKMIWRRARQRIAQSGRGHVLSLPTPDEAL